MDQAVRLSLNKGHTDMPSLFATPDPDLEDQQVISEIHAVRASLAAFLRVPKRWNGLLRRTTTARAIQGSNTIEGYTVSAADAVAAVDDEPPLSADDATWLEILAFRRVLMYVLNVATEPASRSTKPSCGPCTSCCSTTSSRRCQGATAPGRSSCATTGAGSTSTGVLTAIWCPNSCAPCRSRWPSPALTTRWCGEPWRT